MNKKLFLIVLSVVLIVMLSGCVQQNNQNPVIYVSIITHNEEPLEGVYPDFVNNEAAFWEHREAVVSFAKMLHEEGVKYNYQSDWNFLLAATIYDKGTSSTNGKNFLRYLKEDLGFEIDPHAHETQYNYADVAYLIGVLGVEPSHTVGGFLASPPEQSKMEYLRNSLKGLNYPDYSWKAEILWGGATARHQNDEPLSVSGIWKPMDNENFLVHDDSAPLPAVGGYKGSLQGLNDLLRKQQNGELETGKIYTQTLFSGQIDMLQPSYIENFRQQIRSLSVYTDAGLIKWVGLKEVVEIWKSEYNSEPNIYAYASAPQPNTTGEEKIGFVGCSLTLGALSGYSTLGGTKFWPYQEANAYPGGTVSVWYNQISSDDSRWQTFQSLVGKYANTKKIWWELCTGTDSNTYAQLTTILDKIRMLAPGAEIYVSAIPQRSGYTCSLENNDYTVQLQDYAEQLASEGKARQGPAMTPLTVSQVGTDKCHPNSEGQAIWGQNLADFFGSDGASQNQNQTAPSSRCGDGVCQAIERQTGKCQQDCQ